jgi:HEAT repeat protein
VLHPLERVVAGEERPDVPMASREAVAPPGSGVTLAEMVARDAAIAVLLRQLSSGLSAYRLFPGDLRQPSFVAAVERIRGAAEKALQWGPVETEILGGTHFRTASGPVAPDERIERLALACYQHRVERFSVKAAPDTHDLAVLYEALSSAVAEDGAGSNIAASLRVAGVTSIGVSEIGPQATQAERDEFGPSPEQRALWNRLEDPEAFAEDLLDAEQIESFLEQAEAVFRRLQHLVALLPEKQAKGFELYRRLHEVVANLPPAVRRAIASLLVQRAAEDPLAERFVGTLTDADLARMLVDLGVDGGPNPLDLANRLVSVGARREDLVDLTMALLAGQEEGGTILVGLERVGITVTPRAAGSRVADTVSDLVARGLLGMGQDDIRAIRDVFPSSEEDERQLALEAFRDYLSIVTDLEQLGEVLTIWLREITEALQDRDGDQVARLLHVLEFDQRGEGLAAEKQSMIDAFRRRVLDRELLAELITSADDDAGSTLPLLEHFGEIAVECLLVDLAEEQEQGRRALLLSALSELARKHRGPVTKRLSDLRWYVARNAVTILYRSGGPEVVPTLVEASRHPHAVVRREAVTGLLEVAGLSAIPELLRLASDPDGSVRASVLRGLGGMISPDACSALGKLAVELPTPADRRRVLEELAHHPAREASEILQGLASPRNSPRLPWRLRRYAKALLRERREGKR